MATENRQPPRTPSYQPYLVLVSRRFVCLSLLSSTLLAFAIGQLARLVLLDQPSLALLEQQNGFILASADNDNSSQKRNLPTLVLSAGKLPPQTIYTSKHFDTTQSSRFDSRWVLAEENSHTASQKAATAEDEKEKYHQPSGQHLLIDIENVDAYFLDSEERLAEAMIKLVNQCGLTLLSYHCHGLEPTGVSCVGVLLESHVSFHTWPNEGVITLDLFTCGPNSLLPVVDAAETLFAIPSSVSTNQGNLTIVPKMIWARKYRGFHEDSVGREDSDLDVFAKLGIMVEYKKEIASVQTKLQRVSIYDLLRPRVQSKESYERSLLQDGSYESQNPKLFQPDRLVFLDGVLQSRRSGDAAYHETLVHPAMFAHDNPKRVAIVGGGEGATLREVLKHNTVETVVMIEIDEIMVNVSKEYLPEWNDCGNIVGSSKSCMDDPRAQFYFEDAIQWFTDRFSSSKTKIGEDLFDVIIMDALDPQIEHFLEGGEFAEALYDGQDFLESLFRALSDDGVLLTQVGKSPNFGQSAEDYSTNQNRIKFIGSLGKLGFKSIQDFEEGHCGFGSPWHFLVATKSLTTRINWYSNEAAISYQIRKRSMPTLDGNSPFLYFDGATMIEHKFPPKNCEVVFCRRDPTPSGCEGGHGFDESRPNLRISALEGKESVCDENSVQGEVETIDIRSRNYYTDLGKAVYSVQIEPGTYKIADQLGNLGPPFIRGYESSSSCYGAPEIYAGFSTQLFTNKETSRADNDSHVQQEHSLADCNIRFAYNPVMERQTHVYSNSIPAEGQEPLQNNVCFPSSISQAVDGLNE